MSQKQEFYSCPHRSWAIFVFIFGAILLLFAVALFFQTIAAGPDFSHIFDICIFIMAILLILTSIFYMRGTKLIIHDDRIVISGIGEKKDISIANIFEIKVTSFSKHISTFFKVVYGNKKYSAIIFIDKSGERLLTISTPEDLDDQTFEKFVNHTRNIAKEKNIPVCDEKTSYDNVFIP